MDDQVGYLLNDVDRAQFKASVSIAHDWDKIIPIHPEDHTRYFDL